jgi:LysR family transcriptional regulator, hypochlorite-specific transcription factor HypT
MRLDWLKDIACIAETGSFSEAARRRNLTQSAFSRRIQQIEDYLGIELFDRTKKPIQLRPTTAEHLDRITRMIGSMNQLSDDLRRGDRVAGSRLAIASQHALSTSVTPGILRRVLEVGPEVHFRLSSANLDECLTLLMSRQVDLAITFQVEGEAGPFREAFIETMVVGRDRLVPVVGRGDLRRVEARMAEGVLPVITYPGEVFLGEVMARHVFPAVPEGVVVDSCGECALTLAMVELSVAGFGVAWVPLSVVAARVAAGEVAVLEDRLPSVPLMVLVSRLAGAQSATERRVWDRARDLVPQDQAESA